MRATEFVVTEGALYIANHGASFSRGGVIGVCASHLTVKRVDSIVDGFLGVPDDQLVEEIRARELRTYQNDRNRLSSDLAQQEETRLDYAGRFVWELLQNADDAMSPGELSSSSFIGSKGLGVKSVLEITDEPEIHSGPFHFGFSPSETRLVLRTIGLELPGESNLVFRIPHTRSADSTVQGLVERGYSTVVRLPFRDGTARTLAYETLSSVDPAFLLFVNWTEKVILTLPDGSVEHSIERDVEGIESGRPVVTTIREGVVTRRAWQRWTISRRPEGRGERVAACSVCLPVDDSGKAMPLHEVRSFYSFFPTDEGSGCRALLHVPFDLIHNRKRFRSGPHDESILEMMGSLLSTVLCELTPATALEFLGALQAGDTTGVAALARARVEQSVRTTAFVPTIGGGKSIPSAVRLWSGTAGRVLRPTVDSVKRANLVIPELLGLYEELKRLGAGSLDMIEWPLLLCHCINTTQEECRQSIEALLEILGKLPEYPATQKNQALETLRGVPCWWTKRGPRSLDGNRRLLTKEVEGWPRWLPVDVLNPAMEAWLPDAIREAGTSYSQNREVSSYDNWDFHRRWEDLTHGLILSSRREYLEWVLLPGVSAWKMKRWTRDGGAVLVTAHSWLEPTAFINLQPTTPELEGMDVLAKLSRALRIPTDKGWLPAYSCYAGKKWGMPQVLSRYFKNLRGRGIVLPLKSWPKVTQSSHTLEEWSKFLRFIGVSWGPKVFAIQEWQDAGLTDLAQALLGEYRAEIARKRNHKYVIVDWYIEGFPECAFGINSCSRLVSMLRPVLDQVKDLRAKYLKQGGGREHSANESFASFQLRESCWLPTLPSLERPPHPRSHKVGDIERTAPSGSYLPGKGLHGFLPEASKDSQNDEVWFGEIVPFLKGIGVKDRLPEESYKWTPWLENLPHLARSTGRECWHVPDEHGGKAGVVWKAAKSLFSEYLRLPSFSGEPSADIEIPCLVWDSEASCEALDFKRPNQQFWLDQSSLDTLMVRRALMKGGFSLFILQLDSGRKAPKRLGIRPVSEVLTLRALEGSPLHQETASLLSRYSARRDAIETILRPTSTLPTSLGLRVCEELLLELKTEDGALLVQVGGILAWKSEDGTFLIGGNRFPFRALAYAIAQWVVHDPDAQDTVENLLRPDQDEFIDRLRYHGLSEDDIRAIGREEEEGIQKAVSENMPTSETEVLGEVLRPAGIEMTQSDVQETRASSEVAGEPKDHDQSRRAPTESEERRRAETSETTQRLTTTDGPSSPDPEEGRRAEDWLCSVLERVFGSLRVRRRVRDQMGRESDFVVEVGRASIHIEAKCMSRIPGTVYWSDLEIEKATLLNSSGVPYFMALLWPASNENGYELRWLRDPLRDLENAERNIQWEGRTQFSPLQPGGWSFGILRPRALWPAHFKIRIRISDFVLQGAITDRSDLRGFIAGLGTAGVAPPEADNHE